MYKSDTGVHTGASNGFRSQVVYSVVCFTDSLPQYTYTVQDYIVSLDSLQPGTLVRGTMEFVMLLCYWRKLAIDRVPRSYGHNTTACCKVFNRMSADKAFSTEYEYPSFFRSVVSAGLHIHWIVPVFLRNGLPVRCTPFIMSGLKELKQWNL